MELVAEFVSGIIDLFGGFKERAEQVSNALRSPEVAFVLVTSPDPLAIGEPRFYSDKREDAGKNREANILNQVHTLIDEPTIPVEQQIEALVSAVPDAIVARNLLPRLTEALADERVWAIADGAQVERLGQEVGDETRIVEVPAFDQDVHDLAALARVAAYLTDAA